MKSNTQSLKKKTGKNERKKFSFLNLLSNLFFLLGIAYLLIIFSPIIRPEIEYQINRWKKIEYQIASPSASVKIEEEVKNLKIQEPINITPLSTDFGIIIEKINVNSKVVPDVGVSAKSDYWTALEQEGVAHTKGTKYPGQYGNSYLFAHSTVDPLNINRYNASFTLLNKLEAGDRIVTFYEGTRYDYFVESKEIVDPSNTEPLTKQYDEPTLTLQTCHPPGTDFKRLIIVAKMKEEDYDL